MNIAMNYRAYLMQMVQRGKAIKTGGKLQVMNRQPYVKRSFSGSTGIHSGGTVKKLILEEKLLIRRFNLTNGNGNK